MMASQPFAERESPITHRAPVSHHPVRKRKCENRLRRGISLYTSGTSPTALLSLLVVLLSWSCLLGAVSAAELHGDRVSIVNDDLVWKRSSLHLDTRPPPVVLPLMPPILAYEDVTKTLSAPPSKRSLATAASSSAANIVVPKPFDTGLSNNFTNSCASFMSRLLKSDAFNSCHPFSLLMQVRQSLLMKQNPVVLTQHRHQVASLTRPNRSSASHRLSKQHVLSTSLNVQQP